MQEFLDLLNSEESVERDYLKNILHKLYAKVSLFSRVETADIQADFTLPTWFSRVSRSRSRSP